jgi:hypothetical protein
MTYANCVMLSCHKEVTDLACCMLPRIAYPEQVISPAGEWNPLLRRLVVTVYGPRNWAGYGTSSEWDGTSWSFSGAARLNAFVSTMHTVHAYLNEVRETQSVRETHIGMASLQPSWLIT